MHTYSPIGFDMERGAKHMGGGGGLGGSPRLNPDVQWCVQQDASGGLTLIPFLTLDIHQLCDVVRVVSQCL